DGTREAVPVAALRAGDIACVAIGEVVPADGRLLESDACFEEALLTGESNPIRKLAGAEVFAGTICREQPARLHVIGVGADTRLSQLARLVEDAQAHRPQLARLADRIAGWFVLALLIAAVLVWLGWRIHDPSRALEVTLALLVISCPCALSLSIPAALAVANGTLARIGVLPLRPDALETLADITDVVFDKTGTLSDGRPQRASVEVFNGFDASRALSIAAALERDSGHPLMHVFAGSEDGAVVDMVRAVPGAGIEGRVDGITWRLGHAGFACGGDDDGHLWLNDGTRRVARFGVQETARPEAAAAIAALRAQGLCLHLSSGDSHAAAMRFGQALGIANVHARQTPEQKLAFVRSLQSQGCRVAMVGDGLNDAPVLAGADVSLALADGAALAQRAADLVMTHPSLMRIPETVALARRTRMIIKQNLAWALGYNLIALPLAAMGLVTPWLAALGMAASSLTVTLNALRLSPGRTTQQRPTATAMMSVSEASKIRTT
ncbi:MAG: heavy metal translocating P-type ATPase, partial [Thermomonas sp.]